MSIRLIRVSKELNVGISSLVEFLDKNGIQIEANPNVKIDYEHYELLVIEFGKDKNIKKTVDKKREKQLNKEKKETVAIEGYDIPDKEQKESEEKATTASTTLTDDIKPQFKVVGNIDLDNLKTKPKKEVKVEKEQVKQETASPESKEKELEQKTEVEKAEETKEAIEEITPKEAEPKEVKKETSQKEVKVEKEIASQISTKDEVSDKKLLKEKEVDSDIVSEEIEEERAELEVEEIKAEEKDESEEDKDLFRLDKSSTLKTNIVVKGSIDLSSINERTRPARKSRAQRKKERLEREGKKTRSKKEIEVSSDKKKADETEDTTRKKRRRIKKGKVNIERTGITAPSTRRRRRPILKKPVRKEVSEEDVQKQIKETLARLTQKGIGGRTSARHRREKRRDAEIERQKAEVEQREKESRILQLTEFVTANDLANMMDIPVTDVIQTCMSIGIMVAINQRLDAEAIDIVADEFGFKTEYVSADVVEAITQEEDDEKDLIARSPIVTVMGHVDHGKTSLLDSIRNTNVIAGEAGGITQHIGAYHVSLKSGKKITFLDTPGHEAFTAMRARGAKVTDVAIIIVAADDNVMPQTVEAINHASAAGVPIVFAINKIDKPGANPEKVKEELAQMNYLVEDWGGKYQSQDISAKEGTGVYELLEKVLLEAELLELKANPDRSGFGSVVESSLDKGRGYVSTVLVQNGTLKVGDVVLAGAYFGRIKAMFNERNQNIEKTGPGEPALILGLDGAPQAGDKFHVLESEQEARSIATKREQLQREQSIRTQKILTLDDIGRRIAIGNFQELNIIVKGDVDGSVEALSDSLMRLSTEEIEVNVIHKAVGQISESDITLAAASDGIIIGFQVRPSLAARKEAEQQGIDIRLYSVIYDAIEEVTAAMEGMLSPDIKEEITANIEVLEVFKISKVGTIAGCIVRDGKVKRSNKIRLIRDGIVVYTGELESLKRFKDDVREVSAGYECGLNIQNFNDIKVGDTVEAYEEVEVRKTL
ncbi:MAG TPA: translation initiation factor IF-2 [Dysgonamonadaceae bacterium]|nr:translation initiation factor IF-2 [Dysgonamonadaceae bacterium]